MKSMTFVNERNGEQVVCDDVRAVQVIDGVDYLVVHKQDNPRPFMMRKDALKKVNGVSSVVVCTPFCEIGSMGSFPIRHPKYVTLADVVIAPV